MFWLLRACFRDLIVVNCICSGVSLQGNTHIWNMTFSKRKSFKQTSAGNRRKNSGFLSVNIMSLILLPVQLTQPLAESQWNQPEDSALGPQLTRSGSSLITAVALSQGLNMLAKPVYMGLVGPCLQRSSTLFFGPLSDLAIRSGKNICWVKIDTTTILMKGKQLKLFCKIFAYGHTLFPRELQSSWDMPPLPMYWELVNSLSQLQ